MDVEWITEIRKPSCMKLPLRILHLEDNEFDRELIRMTLEADGIGAEWTYVKNRDEFWAAAQACEMDLILADYALPAFNGLAALSLAQAACPHIPFIFVSGELGEERAIESLKQGAIDYVIKSRLTRLPQVVRRALREAEERSERQKIEAALRESEERYRSLIDATTSVVWTTDAEGNMKTPSPSWEAYTGQHWPDYADLGWLEMNHPDEREAIELRWQKSVSTYTPYLFEGRLWHAASAQFHYYTSRGVPIRDEQGNVREWVGTITDIHERRLAQKAAQAVAEQQMRSQAVIASLSQALTATEVVEVIVQHGMELLGAKMGIVRLMTPDGKALEMVRSAGYPPEELKNWRLIPLTTASIASDAANSKEPIWLESREAYWARYANMVKERPLLAHEAIVAIPLVFENRVLGTLGFSFAEQRKFSQAERDMMLTLARQCAQALERARLFESEQQARAEAQALNRELEARVEERTVQLETALSELRSMNEALEMEVAERQKGEERFRLVVESVMDYGIFTLDTEGRVTSWNIGAERIKGYRAEEIIGQHFSVFFPPEDIAWGKPGYELQKARDEGRFEDEGWRVRQDGSRFWANVILTALHNERGELAGFSKVTRDLSLRKQMEEELRASREELRRLSGYLQAAREEERTRISREIHDQLGGSLTALKMDVRQLQKSLNNGKPDPATNEQWGRLNAMAQLIDEAAQTIRRIAADLRPGVLDDLGLEAAIEWQLQDFQNRSGIQCELVTEVNELNMDRDGSTALFRVFQETLTNVARHAQATRVEVNLAQQPDSLILQVRDNGRGITDQDMLGTRSLGLVGMRERIRALNGELKIQGSPGLGTTVMARIPLQHETAPATGFR